MQTTRELAAEAEAALAAHRESAEKHVDRLVKAGLIGRETASNRKGSSMLLSSEEDRETVTLTIRCYALTVGDEDGDEALLRKFWLPSIDNPAPREYRDFEIIVREVTKSC